MASPLAASGGGLLSLGVGLVTRVLSALLSPIDRIVGGGYSAPPNGAAAARRFRAQFEARYGPEGPVFLELPLMEVLDLAATEHKMVMVYLHSELHQDVDTFCRGTLQHPPLVDFLKDLLVWGGNVADKFGLEAETQCDAMGFPFVAVYMPKSRKKFQLVYASHEALSGPELLRGMQEAIAVGRPILEAAQASEVAFQADRMLRDEQNRRFEEAMLKDQEAEAKREEAERLRQQEAENAELERAVEFSRQLSKEADLDRIRKTLPAEPRQGEPDVTVLRVTLPMGSKIQRRFRASDTLQTLFDFVKVTLADLGADVKGFDVGCSMPRRVFSASSDLSIDLKTAQLCPQAVVFVTPTQ